MIATPRHTLVKYDLDRGEVVGETAIDRNAQDIVGVGSVLVTLNYDSLIDLPVLQRIDPASGTVLGRHTLTPLTVGGGRLIVQDDDRVLALLPFAGVFSLSLTTGALTNLAIGRPAGLAAGACPSGATSSPPGQDGGCTMKKGSSAGRVLLVAIPFLLSGIRRRRGAAEHLAMSWEIG